MRHSNSVRKTNENKGKQKKLNRIQKIIFKRQQIEEHATQNDVGPVLIS